MITPPLYANESAESYFAHAAISHSKIKVFRHNRRKFYEQFVSRSLPMPEPTAAMELGTATHTLLLEPALIDSRVKVIPPDVLSSSGARTGAKWKSFEEENHGFALIKQGEFDAARSMAAAILENRLARSLLESLGVSEQSIYWTCDRTGVECKARLDLLLAQGPVIIDIKTTQDPSPRGFADAIARLGYQRQAGFYRLGVELSTGKKADFVFIAVGKEPPHQVGVYEINNDDVKRGLGQCYAALGDIAACRKSGDWTEPFERKIITLGLPKWTQYDDQYEVL